MIPSVWIQVPLEGDIAVYVDADEGDEGRVWDWVCASDEKAALILSVADAMEAVPT